MNSLFPKVVKQRSRKLTALVEGFESVYSPLVGKIVQVHIVDEAADGYHLVGHMKNYTQACL